ncbi:exodeoxyribonuclease III [Motiliproteus sediminis]|uniref:exodeoxyribonuclease III n=1 Tax=Motiliproteus sediminis TaxID=1468178 RepID=UPI001AF001A1|nr:exodeoxyribonuclease III [Motiliproteus sediminis]
MRVITLNVQGIKEAAEKGLFDWMIAEDADVYCLQDLRAKEYELDDALYHPNGYYPYFFDAFEDGYSGVAIYCKQPPKAIMTGLGFEECDFHGRFIQADYDKVSIASMVIPSGLKDDAAQSQKFHYMENVLGHLKKTLRKRRQFIFCGTWSIAHKTLDLSNWYVNQKNSGFLPEERQWLDVVFGELGYIDAFREVNHADHQYTWWPPYNRAYSLNEGARIDYQVTTPGLRKTIRDARILKGVRFSEHAPLLIDYNQPL